jgi:hypothetical protein
MPVPLQSQESAIKLSSPSEYLRNQRNEARA